MPCDTPLLRAEALARDGTGLPLRWGCDFLLGEPNPGEGERHVLCEITVSSVAPFPRRR
jgi:hypothetical protein